MFVVWYKELFTLYSYVRRLCRVVIIPHNGLFWFLLSSTRYPRRKLLQTICRIVKQIYGKYGQVKAVYQLFS